MSAERASNRNLIPFAPRAKGDPFAMTTAFRVSLSNSVVAVSALDPSQRARMASAQFLNVKSFKRATEFDQVSQVRSSRAKSKSGQDAGRVNGSAEDPRTRELGRKISGRVGCARVGAEEIRPALPTEDAARRSFAAVRVRPGLLDRIRTTARANTDRRAGK
jgi:hypothetical protein